MFQVSTAKTFGQQNRTILLLSFNRNSSKRNILIKKSYAHIFVELRLTSEGVLYTTISNIEN